MTAVFLYHVGVFDANIDTEEIIMFRRKFKLFRLMGFEVGVDPSWSLLAVLVVWSLSTSYFPPMNT